MSKLQEKPLALKREHPALQKPEIYQLFSMFVGHFCPHISGSTALEKARQTEEIAHIQGSGDLIWRPTHPQLKARPRTSCG